MLWPAVAVLRALTSTSEDEERCDERAYELLLQDVPPTRGLGWLLEDEDDARLTGASKRLNDGGHRMTVAMLKLACQLITGKTERRPEQRNQVGTLATIPTCTYPHPFNSLNSRCADDQHPPLN